MKFSSLPKGRKGAEKKPAITNKRLPTRKSSGFVRVKGPPLTDAKFHLFMRLCIMRLKCGKGANFSTENANIPLWQHKIKNKLAFNTYNTCVSTLAKVAPLSPKNSSRVQLICSAKYEKNPAQIMFIFDKVFIFSICKIVIHSFSYSVSATEGQLRLRLTLCVDMTHRHCSTTVGLHRFLFMCWLSDAFTDC